MVDLSNNYNECNKIIEEEYNKLYKKLNVVNEINLSVADIPFLNIDIDSIIEILSILKKDFFSKDELFDALDTVDVEALYGLNDPYIHLLKFLVYVAHRNSLVWNEKDIDICDDLLCKLGLIDSCGHIIK